MMLLRRTLLALLLLIGPAPAFAAVDMGDLICETTTTTGTGTLNLDGALTGGYVTFVSQITSGSQIPYTISTGSGGSRKLESGWGTFTDATPDTLTRVAEWSSDGSGAELTLSGTSNVCLGPIAAMFYNGAGLSTPSTDIAFRVDSDGTPYTLLTLSSTLGAGSLQGYPYAKLDFDDLDYPVFLIEGYGAADDGYGPAIEFVANNPAATTETYAGFISSTFIDSASARKVGGHLSWYVSDNDAASFDVGFDISARYNGATVYPLSYQTIGNFLTFGFNTVDDISFDPAAGGSVSFEFDSSATTYFETGLERVETRSTGATGSLIQCWHNTASADANDVPCAFQVLGGADDETIGSMRMVLLDGATTTEDTVWESIVRIAGADATPIKWGNGVIIGTSTTYPGAGNLRVDGLEIGHDTQNSFNCSGGDCTVEAKAIKRAGKQVMYIPAAAMKANATTGATCGATYDSGSNDLTIGTCQFADGASELRVDFGFAMPKAWNESTVTYQTLWTAASGSGTFQAEVGCAAISDDDTLNTTMGTTVTQSDTLLATNDLHISSESSAITIGGTPAENDYVHCRLSRDTSVDTLNATVELIGIKFYWTDNAATLAE